MQSYYLFLTIIIYLTKDHETFFDFRSVNNGDKLHVQVINKKKNPVTLTGNFTLQLGSYLSKKRL